MSTDSTSGGKADFTQSGNPSAGAPSANGAGTLYTYAPGAELSFTLATGGAGASGATGGGEPGGNAGIGSFSLSGASSDGTASGKSAGSLTADGGSTLGNADDAAAQQYYFAGAAQPVGFSLLPSATGADSLTNGAGSNPFTASVTDTTPISGASSLDLFSLNTSNEALYGPGPGSLLDGPNAGGAPIDQYAKGGNSTHGGNGGNHGGNNGGGSNSITLSQNNLTFVINWDSSVSSAPGGANGFEQGFEDVINNYFLTTFGGGSSPNTSSPSALTITLDVGWGEVAGQSLSPLALGESSTNLYGLFSYDQLAGQMKTDFTQSSSDSNQTIAAEHLPSSNPIAGTGYVVSTAEAKALGLLANGTSLDGSVGFSSGVNWNFTPFDSSGTDTTGSSQFDFYAVAAHEISETMGRLALFGRYHGTNYYSALDLYRYSEVSNTPQLDPSQNTYFSFNGGTDSGSPNLAKSEYTYFSNSSTGGDLGDWQYTGQYSAGSDAYAAAAGYGPYSVSAVDASVLNVLGYKLA